MAGYLGIDNSPNGSSSTAGISGVVDTFASLPAASAHNGQVYLVKQSTGTFLINRKSKGFYLSDGATWSVLPEIEAYAALAGATFTGAISATNLSNTNTGDETNSTILSKLGLTPEDVSNKSTSGTLGSSDTLYPTQKAVKTYADSLVFNPRTTVYMFEDFEKGRDYYNGSGWTQSTAASSSLFIGVDTTREGTLCLQTAATNGSRISSRYTNGLLFSNGIITYEATGKLDTIDAVNNTLLAMVGLGNSSVSSLSFGACFEYNTSGRVNPNWYCISKDTLETAIDSGVVVAAAIWYRFKIIVTNNTEIKYYIDDNLVATITTNIIPTTTAIGPLFYVHQLAAVPASTRRVHFDYVTYTKNLTTPR